MNKTLNKAIQTHRKSDDREGPNPLQSRSERQDIESSIPEYVEIPDDPEEYDDWLDKRLALYQSGEVSTIDPFHDGKMRDLQTHAEEMIIAACLTDPDTARKILNEIRPEDFLPGSTNHRRDIYRAILRAQEQNQDINTMTVLEGLSGNESLIKRVKQWPFQDYLKTKPNIDRYIRWIKELRHKKKLYDTLGPALLALKNGCTSREVVEDLRLSLDQIIRDTPHGESLITMSHAGLLAADFSQDEIVSEGILGPQRTLLILGAPKTGKTLLAMNLAVAIAQGSNWLGFDIPEPQRVLFCSGEGGPVLLQTRLRMMLPPDQIQSTLDFWCSGEDQLLLDNPASQERLMATMERLDISVVVLDPLIRFHALDENSTQDMSQLVDVLARIRHRTNAAMVIVHHARKPGMGSNRNSVQEARGSSVLHGDIDSAVVLNQNRSKRVYTVSFELRWAPEPPKLTLSLDNECLTFSVVGEESSGSDNASDEELLQVVRKLGECKAAVIAEMVGKENRTIQRNLVRLEKAGRVTHRPGRNNAKIWSIREEKE